MKRARRSLLCLTALGFVALLSGIPATSEEVGSPLKKGLALGEKEVVPVPHALDRLKHHPPEAQRPDPRKGIPPAVAQEGLIFCGERIPLERSDILQRIEYQINYLLTDFLDTTRIWLKRKDRYGQAVRKVLAEEGLPDEFVLIPALESGYSSSAVSRARAGGWWQFVRPTAARSKSSAKGLEWTLEVNELKDERQDLTTSTRAAARYLKYMRSRLGDDNSEQGSWLTAAAAYNAGLSETVRRVSAYDTSSYWDMKLPLETEEYVPRWIALFLIGTNREYYGIQVPRVRALEFETLEKITLEKDLPLKVLASLTASSVRDLRGLNGALRNGEHSFKARRGSSGLVHTIHVPMGCRESVMKDLRSRAYLKDSF